jgi:hypothetical protein
LNGLFVCLDFGDVCMMSSKILWIIVDQWSYCEYIILGIIIPTDELIFFRGVGQPPTS